MTHKREKSRPTELNQNGKFLLCDCSQENGKAEQIGVNVCGSSHLWKDLLEPKISIPKEFLNSEEVPLLNEQITKKMNK